MNKAHIIVGGLLTAAAQMTAGAAFEKFDRDADGGLSPRELAAVGLFQDRDSNDDGYLEPSELSEEHAALVAWDVDGDSRLSEIEFHRGLFGQADADDDRRLDAEEYGAEVTKWTAEADASAAAVSAGANR